MSPLAPSTRPSTAFIVTPDPDVQSMNLLELFDGYDRARAKQCWADDIVGIGDAEGDSCQQLATPDCGLGLCPTHCKEVH